MKKVIFYEIEKKKKMEKDRVFVEGTIDPDDQHGAENEF